MVPVSARAKTNLDLLLEMILLVADMQDLKANPARPAMGTVLEAQLDRGRGPVATVLVRNGTLKVGDYFICGSVFGRVRAMFDDRGAPVREVSPSMPAEVLGLESLPEVGDTLQVVTDTAKAKQIVIYREAKAREVAMSKTNRITLDQLHDQLKEGETKELNIILKTDVGGTAEVLTDTLQKLSNDKVKIRVLHSGVGAITETDVLLASASNAIIVGFNVRPERTAQAVAEQEKVDIRLHTIIYELADEIKKRHDRHAGAGVQGSLQGPRAGARSVPHQQGRRGGRLHGGGRSHRAQQRSSPAARQRCDPHRQDRRSQALQERRERSEARLRMRHLARELQRHQAGRRDRSVRHRARRDRSFRLSEARGLRMPSVGVIILELRLDESHSLKDKRHYVKSLKDRLRSRFNVSVAEIDYQDLWQRGLIAVATVSSDQPRAEQVLQSVERDAAQLLGPLLVNVTTEWLA